MLRIQIITGSKVPLYRQVVDQIRSAIASGKLTVGDTLPSVRTLAAELIVNPNTIAKAYQVLLADGVVESQQGRGYFVAKRREIYTKVERQRRLDEAIRPVIAEALSLGFAEDEIISAINQQFRKLASS